MTPAVAGRSNSARRYRRARTIVCYWREGRAIVANYATGRHVAADPAILELLLLMDEWTTPTRVASALGVKPALIEWALRHLVAHSLAEVARPADARREKAWAPWASWSPQAPFFHFGVRDVDFAHPDVSEAFLREKAKSNPPPPRIKAYPQARVVALPEGDCEPSLERTLLHRRTWRRFGDEELMLAQLATLLKLTWGVQAWMDQGYKRSALKTSPSGGARHSIEAYVLARRVSGLAPGLYHYDPEGHRLHVLRTRKVPAAADYLPNQSWANEAAAVVIMTSVFARVEWKYQYARAYRSIMFEAGHLCQTFLLLATSLGLAPFCTGALADTRVERDLGIDGVSEAVLYACGVGTRPAGVDWARSPDAPNPRVFPPRHQRRRVRSS